MRNNTFTVEADNGSLEVTRKEVLIYKEIVGFVIG